ncbi:MAG: phosphoribosylaminoimidazole carboxylase [Syntrophorhabdus sp.]|jgi:cupin 2 domain-containing protein
MEIKNLFKKFPDPCRTEIFETILEDCSLRIERIISEGQATPAGQWYDQACDEWVVLLQGSAGILFEGDPNFFVLKPGDYFHIHAHKKHRVEWTDSNEKTIWLAVHMKKQEKRDGREKQE